MHSCMHACITGRHPAPWGHDAGLLPRVLWPGHPAATRAPTPVNCKQACRAAARKASVAVVPLVACVHGHACVRPCCRSACMHVPQVRQNPQLRDAPVHALVACPTLKHLDLSGVLRNVAHQTKPTEVPACNHHPHPTSPSSTPQACSMRQHHQHLKHASASSAFVDVILLHRLSQRAGLACTGARRGE